jgi:hypothetical protein
MIISEWQTGKTADEAVLIEARDFLGNSEENHEKCQPK